MAIKATRPISLTLALARVLWQAMVTSTPSNVSIHVAPIPNREYRDVSHQFLEQLHSLHLVLTYVSCPELYSIEIAS